jgi:hypothetical protein
MPGLINTKLLLTIKINIMQLSGYLVITKGKGWKNSAKFVKTAPSLRSNEISVKLECEIPDALFTVPQLKFNIKVPKEAVPQKEISADVVGNIQQLIQQSTGFEVKLIAETTE